MIAEPYLEPVLSALPASCKERLLIMGWGQPTTFTACDPERALRRAIGTPLPVSLVDLELDPERWHGCYVTTLGTVSWSRGHDGVTCLGRLWINTTLYEQTRPLTRDPRRFPSSFRARTSGILLADPQLRRAYRNRHQSPGGYGYHGLFIAELAAIAIQLEGV